MLLLHKQPQSHKWGSFQGSTTKGSTPANAHTTVFLHHSQASALPLPAVQAVEKKRGSYLTACQKASLVAQRALEGLCESLNTKTGAGGSRLQYAIAALHLNEILLTTSLHARESVRRPAPPASHTHTAATPLSLLGLLALLPRLSRVTKLGRWGKGSAHPLQGAPPATQQRLSLPNPQTKKPTPVCKIMGNSPGPSHPTTAPHPQHVQHAQHHLRSQNPGTVLVHEVPQGLPAPSLCHLCYPD